MKELPLFHSSRFFLKDSSFCRTPAEVMCLPVPYSRLNSGGRTCLPVNQTRAPSGEEQGSFNVLLSSFPKGQLKGTEQYGTVGTFLNSLSFLVPLSRKYICLGCHQFLYVTLVYLGSKNLILDTKFDPGSKKDLKLHKICKQNRLLSP